MASVWAELKRRNVVKVAVLYVIASWLILQVADVLFVNLGAPDWTFALVLGLLILFFAPVLIFAWVFEMTPEGLKRERDIERSQSITSETGRKLSLVTIALLVVAVVLLLANRYAAVLESDEPARESIYSGTPIVAVLPFKATGSEDGGVLAAGLHDDLLTKLAKLGAFRVISRTSMMEYANTTKNMRQIGEELGAGYILEGGVQVLGNQVHVNAQLIDAAADQHVWADNYDHALNAANLFSIQANLALAIADQLETTLSPSDRSVVSDVPTRNTEAYNAYLLGLTRHLSGNFNANNEKTIVAAFEEAVERDPDFGLAWARLSIARTRLLQITGDASLRDSALAALAHARTLQPDILETELAWVVYLYRGLREYQLAVLALEAIGKKIPLDAESLTVEAWLYRRLGQFDKAYETLLAAQQLDPRSSAIVGTLIGTAIHRGDCDAAGRHAEQAISMSSDQLDTISHLAVYELECTGDAERASRLFENADYETDWSIGVAREAALSARNYELALALAEIPQPQIDAYPLNPIFDQLDRAWALRLMGRGEESAAVLDAVGESLANLKKDGKHIDTTGYAASSMVYAAMRGDGEATLYWAAQHKQRFRESWKGDRMNEVTNHAYYAASLAIAGLQDAAIGELEIMFEEPGGFGFRRVDAWPAFDVLEDNPGYIELRRRREGIR